MAKFIGRRSAVGIGLEASRGTGVSPTYLLAKTNYNLEDKVSKARSGEGVGNISGEGSQAIITNKMAEGEIESEVGVRSLPVVLATVFGQAPSSAAEASDYKHTLTLLESNQHASMSVHLDEPNGDIMFRGAEMDSFEMTVNAEDIVSYTAGMKAYVSRDTVFDASTIKVADYKFVGRDLEFKVAATTADLAAATAICVKELTLTISKNTEFDVCLGSLEPVGINNKQMTIQGSLTLDLEDDTWKDYFLEGSYRAVGIKLTNTRQTMGSENPEFYLELPVCDFSEWEAERGNDDIVQQTFNFTALLDIANNQLISDCYVVNNVASY